MIQEENNNINLILNAFGEDKPGIIAEVSKLISEYNGNIEDSQMAILCGQFSIMLAFSVPESVSLNKLYDSAEAIRNKTGLITMNINTIDSYHPRPKASHIVTIYGVDQPGIVREVSAIVAAKNFNVVDLQTRLVESNSKPLYMLVVEIVASGSENFEKELNQAITKFSEDNNLESKIQKVETF